MFGTEGVGAVKAWSGASFFVMLFFFSLFSKRFQEIINPKLNAFEKSSKKMCC